MILLKQLLREVTGFSEANENTIKLKELISETLPKPILLSSTSRAIAEFLILFKQIKTVKQAKVLSHFMKVYAEHISDPDVLDIITFDDEDDYEFTSHIVDGLYKTLITISKSIDDQFGSHDDESDEEE